MDYSVPEDVGIKNIRSFYDKIKEMMKGTDGIVLDFSGVRSVHLSVTMVVMAALREAKRTGRIIKLKNLKEDVRRQFFLSGFNI